MKIHHIASAENPPDFNDALKRALAAADGLLGENMLLSWYDRERDMESPTHASECNEGCRKRGYWDYALKRGATLAVDFDGGRFIFCFRPLEEFTPMQ